MEYGPVMRTLICRLASDAAAARAADLDGVGLQRLASEAGSGPSLGNMSLMAEGPPDGELGPDSLTFDDALFEDDGFALPPPALALDPDAELENAAQCGMSFAPNSLTPEDAFFEDGGFTLPPPALALEPEAGLEQPGGHPQRPRSCVHIVFAPSRGRRRRRARVLRN